MKAIRGAVISKQRGLFAAARLLSLLALGLSMWSQTKAVLTGTVTDQTGGALSGVKVIAQSQATGAKRAVETSRTGEYVFTDLPPGNYEVRGEKAGFTDNAPRRSLQLSVAETAVADFSLIVTGAQSNVTVREAVAAVNTTTAELSYLVGERAIRDLPLNGRNVTDLAFLQPNVIAYPHRDGGSVVAHGLGASINGQDPRSNVYLLDGTPMNDFTNGPAGSAAGTALGMESIQEFRVETNAYSAEFGRNAGGQINAVTKSGSNSLHGSLYEYFRNDHFDARNFFDPQRIPRFTRNQFGGSVGGPVRKDKTFFFAGYESLRERLGRTITSFTPTAEVRSQAVAAVRPYLDEMPLPNGTQRTEDGLGDYVFSFNQTVKQHYAQGRLDHIFSDSRMGFLRYTFDDADQQLPTDFPQFPRDFLSRNQFATAEHRWVITPNTLHTFRAGIGRTRVGQDVQSNTATRLQPFIQGRDIIGSIDVGGMPRFGTQSSVNVQLAQTIYSFDNSVSMTRGRHILRTGVLAERYQDNLYNPTFSLGIFTFNNVQEFLRNQPLRFIGIPASGSLDRYWRFTLMGFYLQDDFRVSRRLSLNLGLRYEFTTMPRDIYGRDSALINITDSAPTVGTLYQNPTHKNFSPRFGFAWDVLGNGKMSLRGGYGLYFNTNNHQNLIVTITNPPATPRVVVTRAQGVVFPQPPIERGLGNSIRPVDWNVSNPYVHIWNLSLQRDIGAGIVVTAGVAGSRGIHLLRNGDVNLATPVRQADGTYFFPAGAPRINPAFTTIELKRSDGNSWYNAALLEVRKRWSKGLSFQSSYTFSRNIDTTQASTFFSDANNGTTSAMPELPGFNYNKGLADYHAKHNWVANVTYDFPTGQNIFLKGWQASSIVSTRSGTPLTVFVQGNWSRSLWQPSIASGTGLDRPSMAPGRTHQDAVLGDPTRYLDPTAFILPPQGTLGNLGRGAIIGPSLAAMDLSVAKNTAIRKLSESANLQFRAEAFNLLNHTNFGVPSLIAYAGSSATERPTGTFGRIRNTITSSRQIQLALRLTF